MDADTVNMLLTLIAIALSTANIIQFLCVNNQWREVWYTVSVQRSHLPDINYNVYMTDVLICCDNVCSDAQPISGRRMDPIVHKMTLFSTVVTSVWLLVSIFGVLPILASIWSRRTAITPAGNIMEHGYTFRISLYFRLVVILSMVSCITQIMVVYFFMKFTQMVDWNFKIQSAICNAATSTYNHKHNVVNAAANNDTTSTSSTSTTEYYYPKPYVDSDILKSNCPNCRIDEHFGEGFRWAVGLCLFCILNAICVMLIWFHTLLKTIWRCSWISNRVTALEPEVWSEQNLPSRSLNLWASSASSSALRRQREETIGTTASASSKSRVTSAKSIKSTDSLSEQCSICLRALMAFEMKRLECEHEFHVPCLKDWIKKSRTCPICRFKIPWNDHRLGDEPKRNVDMHEPL